MNTQTMMFYFFNFIFQSYFILFILKQQKILCLLFMPKHITALPLLCSFSSKSDFETNLVALSL